MFHLIIIYKVKFWFPHLKTFINSRIENLNRAFNSDSVIVELLPKDKWKEPSTTIIEEGAIGANDNAADGDDEEGGGGDVIEGTKSVISDKERILLAQEAIKVIGSKMRIKITTNS